jgi:hypothetical protein
MNGKRNQEKKEYTESQLAYVFIFPVDSHPAKLRFFQQTLFHLWKKINGIYLFSFTFVWYIKQENEL